jgi:N-acetylneuraminic acid mutarotase
MKTGVVLRSVLFVPLAICLFFTQSGRANWILNGPLTLARYDHTATLLLDGKVLVVGGLGANGVATATAELYNPATGTCVLTGPLTNARSRHTATLLPNGKVLVTGGVQGFTDLASSELYDPLSGTWTNTGPLNIGRFDHTANLLANGKVLVAGGGTSSATATAELYDPATGQWTLTPSMTTARTLHAATLLTNGLVLVTGGQQGSIFSITYLSSAELYDPVSNIWRATASMLIPHESHIATMLPSGTSRVAGKVLVAGGLSDGDAVASCELYDPAAESWSSTGGMTEARTGQTATVLPNGDVLVTGGQSTSGITNTSEIYLTTALAGTWTKPTTMNTPRMGQTATILPSGKVVVIGGVAANVTPDSTVETLYNGGGDWNPGSPTIEHVQGQAATLLPSGKVLVTGGLDTSTVYGGTNADLYDPSTDTWEPTGFMIHNHAYHTSTLLQNGDVLVTGGVEDQTNSEAEVYNSSLGTWTDIGAGEPFASYTATLLLNGKVLFAGGYALIKDVSYVTNECFLYDPAAQTFSETGSLNTARFYDTATLLANGQVLVAGGEDIVGDYIQTCEFYDPDTGQWTQGTNLMTTVRATHSATLLPNGQVLVAGGQGEDYDVFGFGEDTFILTNAEVFDPVTQEWQATGNLNADRAFFTMTLLPNGMVLAAGGMNDQAGLVTDIQTPTAELYDPATGIWTAVGSMSAGRQLQSAVLVPDGQVFVVGGDPTFTNSQTPYPELFNIALDAVASRVPQITSSNSILYPGGALTLEGTLFSDLTGGSGGNAAADSPADYPVVQLRNIETGITTFLPAAGWGSNFFVSIPVTNFPAGYALATVFVNGIESSSGIEQISATAAPVAIILTNLVGLPDGTFQFSFTNTPGALSRAFGATNISTLFSNWTFLGNPTEISSGQFQFDDLQATNFPQRFYRVESP